MIRLLRKKCVRPVAAVFLAVFTAELLCPVAAWALTSGPSQPEMQSFEPVGTTDMVDMFSGDFNYNIPLLDVDGYPVNIAYHSGVDMEQEASWVGLGWNINPGNINHVVRGVSDDFKGDEIKKTVEAKPERNDRFSVFTGMEFAGWDTDKLDAEMIEGMGSLKNLGLSLQLDLGLNISNYNGVSASVGVNHGAKFRTPGISAGINMGTTNSTADGADFNYGANVSLVSLQNAQVGTSFNGGMNSRQGVMYHSFGVNPAIVGNQKNNRRYRTSYATSGSSSVVPIGLMNYVPVITNATSMASSFYQVKIGAELYMLYPNWGGSYAKNVVQIDKNGNRNAYGYFNLEHAGEESITDFARDKDGNVNKKTKFLPMTNMAYDIYAVNGQGTGGSFRPFRSDVGTVYDPLTGTEGWSDSHLLEAGIGNLLEIGYDLKLAYTQAKSGPWKKHYKKFKEKTAGNLREPVYFRQAGELTGSQDAFYDHIGKDKPLSYAKAGASLNGNMPDAPRTPRANLLYFLNGEEASRKEIAVDPYIRNYNFDGFKNTGNTPQLFNRTGTGAFDRKKHHASEFTQVLPDGRRYIYGLPVMNWSQKEYEFSVSPQSGNPELVTGVNYSNGNPEPYDGSTLTQKYYSCTETPAHAHSYLLTNILSPDYTDMTGDGISDDDIGNYTKFNYRRMEEKFQWRAPYGHTSARFSKGVKSNCNDDKAAFSFGTREEWLLHSIESRNYVAEFFVSSRLDAKGAAAPGSATQVGTSYKLDSIVLFNKRERLTDPAAATPIKTVVFTYDYTLCPGAPNASKGKLTLKAIYIKHGNSDIGYLSPYQFKYNDAPNNTAQNPAYNPGAKDCWGSYKPVNSNSDPAKQLGLNLGNNEFPYVNQNDPDADVHAGAWNLKEIILPSGGSIKVTYESDDYGYVQDKHAMEMFKVAGVGGTTNFAAGNELYESPTDPNLYIYFKRKKNLEHASGIAASYLDGQSLLQYTFEVEISPGQLASCPGTPLVESVKGYANVAESGICTNNDDYAYVKLEPKTPTTFAILKNFGVPGVKINPITLNAINFARYYNNRALRPNSEITGLDPVPIIQQLMASMGSYLEFFQNEIKTHVKSGKCKTYFADKSYIRLVSQGLKKKGGGHRVRRLEFKDTWNGSSNTATYGSDYDYTIKDDATGKLISSGVASYEPLFGGDENPCRTLLTSNEYGNRSNFPPVDPIELLQEGPLGESLYPPASVGYRKVTVTSIHKNEGESSRSIQEHEFYTAKEFPVKVQYEDLTKVEDRPPKIWDLVHQKDIYRVAQGYTLYLNDMHGKLKRQSVWVAKNDAENTRECVSYTNYNYFRNEAGELKNDVTCLVFPANGGSPYPVTKTLGEETDYTVDTREKTEQTFTFNGMINVNCFLTGPIPVSIPTAFASLKKQSKTFSSLVNTKVVQRYGIVQSVETYDKGALVKVENTMFDPQTGQVLITKVNTEYNDIEYSVKYPAYWAYKSMGAAYENILYEEEVTQNPLRNDTLFMRTPNAGRFSIGDELELTSSNFCSSPNTEQKFKGWVVGKTTRPNTSSIACGTIVCTDPNDNNKKLMYRGSGTGECLTFQQMKQKLVDVTHDPALNNIPVPFESVRIEEIAINREFPFEAFGAPCKIETSITVPGQQDRVSYYNCEMDPTYLSGGQPTPYNSSHITTLNYTIVWNPFENNNPPPSTGTTYMTPGFNPSGDSRTIYRITVAIPANSATNSTFPNSFSYTEYTDLIQEHKTSGSLGWCDRWLHAFVRRDGSGICSTDPRSDIPNPVTYVQVLPRKKGATTINNTGFAWPQNDNVTKAHVKVVRSGKRNQLSETVQELMTLSNPIQINKLTNSAMSALNGAARTYTDSALVPQNVLDPGSVLINPFVTGRRGNYRVEAEYLPHNNRTYSSGQDIQSDAQRGAYALTSFWSFPTGLNSEFFNRMGLSPFSGNWKEKTRVTAYSPWGGDLEVTDATGVSYSNLFGYNHRIPVAVVKNGQWNESVSENFEDYGYLFNLSGGLSATYLTFHQNVVRKYIADQINASLSGTGARLITTSSHTGRYALEFLSAANISLPAGSGTVHSVLKPFFLRSGQKYVVSLWRKVTTDAPPTNAGMSVNFVQLQPKTPVINGWALYEATVSVPTASSLNMIVPAGAIIDDLRILPASGNMKAYVYDPVNLRLSAILDETHMATFLEYNGEGKLVRVKKETERGVLTLKESRESLKNLLPTYPSANYPNY